MNVQNQLNEALEQLKSIKEENDRMRAYIHDISSPLQILGMSIEALCEQCSEEQKSTIYRMKRSSDKMLEIMKEIRKLQQAQERITNKSKV